MSDPPRTHHVSGCPFVDLDDRRCASRLSLGRVDQAFLVCFGAFHTCPMYHQIGGERTAERRSADVLPLVTVTLNGHAAGLRATGT